MDVLVGKGIGEARVCCVHVSVCVCVCVYIPCVYIYICVPRFRNVYARSLRDIRTRMRVTYVCMRYIERYRVARSDVEESSDS